MIKYLIFDVDGTLTDGGVYYDNLNNEIKKFCVKDGVGFKCAIAAGIEIIILTGRECNATTRRMVELGVQRIEQGIEDKVSWIQKWTTDCQIDRSLIGYVGDDINDLECMNICGWTGCPADAVEEVKKKALYISPINGGYGVARDCIEKILKDNELWDSTIEKVYNISGA